MSSQNRPLQKTRGVNRWLTARALAIVAAFAFSMVIPGGRAEAAPPPPVVGEISQTSGFLVDEAHFSADCNPDGISTISYSVTGVATGTYTGTYTETGTFVIGPYTLQPTPTTHGGGPLLSYTGNFTLDSPDAYITGTMDGGNTPGLYACETIEPGSGSAQLNCQTEQGSTAVRSELYSAYAEADVSAIIRTTSDGTYQADGVGAFSVDRQVDTCANGGVVDNRFSTTRLTLVVGGQIGPGPATSLELTPAAATNPVGTTHTVTATVTDASGVAAQPTTILFTVRGSTNTSGQCTTTTTGSCDYSYRGPDLPGADSITACADNNNNGTCDTGEPTAEASKAWLLPTSTPGQVTGGGQIPDPSDRNYKVSFGFTAKNSNGVLKGECSVVDQSAAKNILIKCQNVTAMVPSGTHATFFGNATVNGASTDYRIDVDDLAEPGKGHDTFKIQTGSGYTTAGTLTQGNIQVHN